MARRLYTLLFCLCMPLVLLRLLYRAIKAPAYARRWSERFALARALPQPRWCASCSSVTPSCRSPSPA